MSKKKTLTKRTPTRRAPAKRVERTYSDEEKADLLLAIEMAGGEGHIKRVAKEQGVPQTTAFDWWHNRHGITPAVAKIRTLKRNGLSDKLYAVSDKLLDRVGVLVETSTDLRAVATALGIAVDKAQLLAGEATARTESHNTNDNRSLYANVTPANVTPKDEQS